MKNWATKGLLTLVLLASSLAWAGNKAQYQPPQVGDAAPAFALPASPDGKVVRLTDLRGKNVIIVFYPGDNTPGCTVQLCGLRDEYKTFQAENTVVLGSNPASLKSHQDFAKKQKYPFPLLVDTDQHMAKAYGAEMALGFNKRKVFVIDRQGIVRHVESGMSSPKKLLTVVRGLNQPTSKATPNAGKAAPNKVGKHVQ
jgi:peroxiredoxin Q/BCP